jgi:NADH-quinone oxidoreductase subunit J
MSPSLFWFFAALMLLFGALVVINRNPVASALSLVVSFLCLAALFVGLDAYFIAVIQVLVYAGAVMVLFLFIIMLLDLRAEARRKINIVAYAGAVAVAIGFVAELAYILDRYLPGRGAFPPLAAGTHDDVRNLGMTFFSTHNLPFQVIGVLLLVATIGVVVLSRRELK